MNLFGWIGVFFLVGGALFVGAALSMSRGRRIAAVEAKIVAVHDPASESEKDSDAPKEEDGLGTTEYEFTHEGQTQRVTVRFVTSREAGESERMYYDPFSGALWHLRTLGVMYIAAAAFAAAGIAMIVFQNALLP